MKTTVSLRRRGDLWSFSPGWRLHLTALGAHVGLAVILLHPLWTQQWTHVAGYDWFNYNWNFWWIRHALHTLGLNVYLNDFVMFPALSNYGYHALTAFWYPLWALLEPLTGTLTAVNVIITLGCVLNGYLVFVWLRSEGSSAELSLLGGMVVQTLPISRYFYYNTHLNLMDWFWLPGLLLMWKLIVRRVGRSSQDARLVSDLLPLLLWSTLFGAALWGLLLTDLQFPIFAAALLVPYGLVTLILGRAPGDMIGARKRRGVRIKLVLVSTVAVAAALALMWWAGPLPYIVRFEGQLVPGPVADRPGIPFPTGFLSMSEEWWQWDRPSLGAFFPLLLLISLGLSRSRPPEPVEQRDRWRRWLWLACALPPIVFALGPTAVVGQLQIPLPFVWLYDATNGMFRMPWRLAPIGVIAGTAFIAMVWTPVLKMRAALKLWGGVIGLLLLFIAIRLFETRPLDPILPDYAFYRAMGAETGGSLDEYVVIDAPTGMGTGEVLLGSARAIQYQWYGVFHHKRMVNGFISRAPIDQFFYIETGDPLLSWLGMRRPLDPALVETSLRERIYDWPIGYIVLHTDDMGRNTATPQEVIGYFNQLGDLLCPIWIEGAAVVYRTAWHPLGCPERTPPEVAPNIYEIDIGTPGDERFIGWGWHWQEDVGATRWRWTGEYPQARLYVDLAPTDYRLTLAAQAFWETRHLTVEMNGVPLQPLEMEPRIAPDSLQEIVFSVPTSVLGDGRQVEIVLSYDDVVVPAEVGQSADPRRLALAVDWIRFAREAP